MRAIRLCASIRWWGSVFCIGVFPDALPWPFASIILAPEWNG
jgi:hypothetical protein